MPREATPSSTGICSSWAEATPSKAIPRPSSAAVSSSNTVKIDGSLLRRKASK